ncbi:MAG TPA: PH domain-containing protein [Anaerolineaceae bacterium]|nr:PH domain-containing protein [Anaerolineaceae bacterium]
MNDPYLKHLLGNHEEILLVTHQHWIVWVQSILLEGFVALIIIAADILLYYVLLFNPLVLLGLILLLIPIASLARDTMIWYNRKYVITSRRVIQIHGVFNKDVIDSSLEKVNDVKMDQSFIGRLFDFGDVEILTASELGVNLFKKIAGPVKFKTTMLNAKAKLEDEQTGHGEHEESDIPSLIARLGQLRQQGIITEAEFQAKKSELLAKL